MAITYVRKSGGQVFTTGNSGTLSGITTTNGDTLIVGVETDVGVASIVTNGTTTAITKLKANQQGTVGAELWRIDGISGVTSITVNFSAATTATHVDIGEFAGLGTLDQTASTQGTSATVASSTLTPAGGGAVMLMASNAPGNFSNGGGLGNGWTAIAGPGAICFAYHIQTSAASDSTTWALFGSTPWASVTVDISALGANPAGGLASATGAANNATVTVPTQPHAEVATGVGSAGGAMGVRPGTASGTGATFDVVNLHGPVPAPATATGAAYDIGVSYYGPALSSAVAFNAVVVAVGSIQVAQGTGTANNPAISSAHSIGVATATGAALQPTVSTSSAAFRNAPGNTARADGVAGDPAIHISVSAFASVALATAAALAPVQKAGPVAGNASSFGQAFAPRFTVTFRAGVGLAVGIAFDAAPTSPSLIFVFSPPTLNDVPPVAYDVPAQWNKLMRFYGNRPSGQAIWVLTDGTFTFTQPFPTIEDTPANRSGIPPQPVDNNNWSNWAPTYTKVYLGGHHYRIADPAELAAIESFLTAEGYNPTDWLVPA